MRSVCCKHTSFVLATHGGGSGGNAARVLFYQIFMAPLLIWCTYAFQINELPGSLFCLFSDAILKIPKTEYMLTIIKPQYTYTRIEKLSEKWKVVGARFFTVGVGCYR